MNNDYKNFSHLNLAEETGNYKRNRNGQRKKKSGFLQVLLKYILPFIVINLIIFFIVTSRPDFTVNIEDNGDYKTASLTINVKTIYPRKEFKVTLADEPVELEETDRNTYKATLEGNGTLEVSLTNLNGMNKTVYENVNCMDDDPPVITEDDSAMGYVSMYVEDTQSGVDYDSIYAFDGNGKLIFPDNVFKDESLVVFNFDAAPLEVHVFDNSGRESIATFAVTGAAPKADSESEIVIN